MISGRRDVIYYVSVRNYVSIPGDLSCKCRLRKDAIICRNAGKDVIYYVSTEVPVISLTAIDQKNENLIKTLTVRPKKLLDPK